MKFNQYPNWTLYQTTSIMS